MLSDYEEKKNGASLKQILFDALLRRCAAQAINKHRQRVQFVTSANCGIAVKSVGQVFLHKFRSVVYLLKNIAES